MTGRGQSPHHGLEVWGGLECTVNRVGNRYFDQLELSGHASRLDDIDLIAALGIRVLRYPLLWERIAPGELERANWDWADARMHRMRELGISPVVGLVHHGSGPQHTSLLDPQFASKLAVYARAVAERYPWIEYVTPVNEPLTTARFSCLYGHWYPHKTSPESFSLALLHQCAAVRAAFRAMREIIPALQLVQTEDLGKTYSRPSLQYQADFENCRRWLTFDLLCGTVHGDHPLRGHLSGCPETDGLLESLAGDACPPDMIGINYYVTSERYLDERLEMHHPASHGGNGQHRYADVEGVRVRREGLAGHASLICEVWERYQRPIAVTEVHLGCTREQQIRWVDEAWRGALDARAKGCDVRAITPWALFGSFGWDTLVTRPPFNYEPGAFDLRSSAPRPTALARIVEDLAKNRGFDHPVLGTPGWWRTDDRLAPPFRPARSKNAEPSRRARPILVTGARGTLGSAFVRLCRTRGLDVQPLKRADLDITNIAAVRHAIGDLDPWAIVNAAGYVRVDNAESERAACYRENTLGVATLAEACSEADVSLVTFSSDLVFDGRKRSPYTESDSVSPLSVYGASKAAAEAQALELHPRSLVVRTSAFFGPWDEYNFITVALRALSEGLPFSAASDRTVSPTYVPDLVHATLDLLVDGESGVWHLANRGATTWSDFARVAASRAGFSADLIEAVPQVMLGRPAQHPDYAVLGSERCSILPTLENALDRYFAEAPLPGLEPVGTW